jgi:hypothetical protein
MGATSTLVVLQFDMPCLVGGRIDVESAGAGPDRLAASAGEAVLGPSARHGDEDWLEHGVLRKRRDRSEMG